MAMLVRSDPGWRRRHCSIVTGEGLSTLSTLGASARSGVRGVLVRRGTRGPARRVACAIGPVVRRCSAVPGRFVWCSLCVVQWAVLSPLFGGALHSGRPAECDVRGEASARQVPLGLCRDCLQGHCITFLPFPRPQRTFFNFTITSNSICTPSLLSTFASNPTSNNAASHTTTAA